MSSKSKLVVKKSAKEAASVASSEEKSSKKSRKEIDLSDAMDEEVKKVSSSKSKTDFKKQSVKAFTSFDSEDENSEDEDAPPPRSTKKVQKKKDPESEDEDAPPPRPTKKVQKKEPESEDENSGDEDASPSKKVQKKVQKKEESSDSDDDPVITLKSSKSKSRRVVEDEEEVHSPPSRSSSRGSSPPSSQRREVELAEGYGFKKTKKGSIATFDLDERYPEICDALNISPSAGRYIMKVEEEFLTRIVSSGTSSELITKSLLKKFGKNIRTKGIPETSSPAEEGIYTTLSIIASRVRKACSIQLDLVESKTITLWMVSFYYLSEGEDTPAINFYTHEVTLTVDEKRSDKRNKPFKLAAPDALCYVIGMMIAQGTSVDTCLWYDYSVPISYSEIMSMFAVDESNIPDTNYSITVSRKGNFSGAVFVMNYNKLGPYMRAIRRYFDKLKSMNKYIQFANAKTGNSMNLAE